jgi:hypothetical protein
MFYKQTIHPKLTQSTSPSLDRRKKHSHRRRSPPGSHHQCHTAVAALSPQTPYRPWVYPAGGPGGGHGPPRFFSNLYLPFRVKRQEYLMYTSQRRADEPPTSTHAARYSFSRVVYLTDAHIIFYHANFFSYIPVNYFFYTYY